MGSWRQNVLKCFLLLVVVAVIIFVYSAATLRQKEQGVVLFTNRTSTSSDQFEKTVSHKSTSNLSDPFGSRFSDSESENLLLQVIENERKRESEKLIFMHSKLKTTTRHSIKRPTRVPSTR